MRRCGTVEELRQCSCPKYANGINVGNIGPVAMAHVPQPQPLAPPASVATYGATAIPSYPPNHEFSAPATSRSPHIPYNGRAPRDNIVRRLEGDLQDVLDELAGREWGREMHAFPYRRLGAHSVM